MHHFKKCSTDVCVSLSVSDRLTKHSQPEGAQRACNTWEGEVLRLLHMRRLSEHLKFGAMLRDGDGERDGSAAAGAGEVEEITDIYHTPCEWFRVTEYLRMRSRSGACRRS